MHGGHSSCIGPIGLNLMLCLQVFGVKYDTRYTPLFFFCCMGMVRRIGCRIASSVASPNTRFWLIESIGQTKQTSSNAVDPSGQQFVLGQATSVNYEFSIFSSNQVSGEVSAATRREGECTRCKRLSRSSNFRGFNLLKQMFSFVLSSCFACFLRQLSSIWTDASRVSSHTVVTLIHGIWLKCRKLPC